MAFNDEVARSQTVWARRFREARLAKGLSQKTVGVLAGLDQFVASTRINRYEVGIHEPAYTFSILLARVLDVPVSYLYCDDDELALVILAFHRATPVSRSGAIKLMQGV